jgi:hypothetical protein
MCSFFIFLTNTSWAATQFVENFEMRSCTKNDICTTLTVHGTAEKGLLAPIFAFSTATVKTVDKKNKSEYVFNAKDGYLNTVEFEIILREVDEISNGDIAIDLKSGSIKKFLKNP